MKQFFNINPYTFTGSAVFIALLLVQELTLDEQDSIGNWLQLIGLTMQTYSSQVTTLDSYKEKKDNNTGKESTDLEKISKVLNRITDEIETLKKNNSNNCS